MTPHHRPPRRKRLLAAAVSVAAATAILLAGCSTGSDDASEDTTDRTLTVAVATPPVSLDPALQNADATNTWFARLAYEPLINVGDDGEYEPGLATSWQYLDDRSTQFELTLREDVVFADGTPMTAADVVATLQYYIAEGVNGATWFGEGTTIEATGDLTVVVTTPQPNSIIPYLLAHRTNLGSVVSAAGMADTEALKSASFGAGPFVLDTERTVANNSYVYTKNENYYRADDIEWEEITIVVSGSASASFQALRSGEIDLMRGDVPTADSADGTDLTVWTVPLSLFGANYLDRAGEISPALGDVRVRQALSYAIDRENITQLQWGDYGVAGNDLAIEGLSGYEESTSESFSYDPEKAMELLEEAGYADGFTFELATPNTQGVDVAAQAIVENWAAIGVTANLTVYSDIPQLITDLLAKKYPVSLYLYGSGPQYLQSKSFFSGGVNQYNPFDSTDEQILTELTEAAASPDPDEQNVLYQSVLERAIVDETWLSNIAYAPLVLIHNDSIQDITVTSSIAAIPNLADLKPAE